MDKVTAQKVRVQAYVKDHPRQKSRLAMIADVPPTTLTGIEDASWNPRASTLAKLAGAIDGMERQDKDGPLVA